MDALTTTPPAHITRAAGVSPQEWLGAVQAAGADDAGALTGVLALGMPYTTFAQGQEICHSVERVVLALGHQLHARLEDALRREGHDAAIARTLVTVPGAAPRAGWTVTAARTVTVTTGSLLRRRVMVDPHRPELGHDPAWIRTVLELTLHHAHSPDGDAAGAPALEDTQVKTLLAGAQREVHARAMIAALAASQPAGTPRARGLDLLTTEVKRRTGLDITLGVPAWATDAAAPGGPTWTP